MRRVAATLPYLAAIAIWLCAGVASAQPQAGGHWRVVLAAGDDEEPVFDNGVAAMARFLTGHGVAPADIHRLSAAETSGAEPATVANLTRRIATLPVGPGDRCLVFVTSHGVHGEGVYLARDDEVLSPKALAASLSRACANVPTVVIVSACYSGSFAAAPVTAPNRVILTASRADRPSFGCQADRVFTVFDECLMAGLPRVTDWPAAFRDTAACVKRRERAWRVPPSYPQTSFGAATRQIPSWF
ncbi:MAG TPA: C13 family peptidase [Stellaceae bacterium]|jgi:hypothetical protein|nr:C13 family peptidase [Stellaceae bacterium]